MERLSIVIFLFISFINCTFSQSVKDLLKKADEENTAIEKLYWLEKAADKGSIFACGYLSDSYIRGDIHYSNLSLCSRSFSYAGVPYRISKDYLKAEKYLLIISEKGKKYDLKNRTFTQDWANYWLGYIYHDGGNGLTQDLAKATKYYKMVIDDGKITDNDKLAEANLKIINDYYAKNLKKKLWDEALACREAGDEKGYFEKMMILAKQDNGAAQSNIGACFQFGIGVDINYEEAISWYQKAIDHGSTTAMGRLAIMYAWGLGTEKNFKKAHEYVDMAISKDKDSRKFIDYDVKGEFYLMQNNSIGANSVWNIMQSSYRDEIDKVKVKNTDQYVFVRTMLGLIENPYIENGSSMQIVDKEQSVDTCIPENKESNKSTFVVIIANEDYLDEENVPFAKNDGKIFTEYCKKTLGIPENNIHFIENATLNNVKRQINWLKQVSIAYDGEVKIIFYYSGHGIPDEKQQNVYLLPVDGFGKDVTTGYELSELYTALSECKSKSVLVFLDACFSGSKKDGGMMASSRGVAIKAKQAAPKGNMVVFSAAQGDETAYPYYDFQHGLFTYYLLRKLQETKGNISLGELSEYITNEVRKTSITINGKMQTPTANGPTDSNDWKSWKLK